MILILLWLLSIILFVAGAALTVGGIGYWIGGGGVPFWALLAGPVCLLIAIRSLSALIGKDEVPDFLIRLCRDPILSANGLTLIPGLEERDGYCWIVVYYQNQHERECKATIVIKPGCEFFHTTRKIDGVVFDLSVGPAEFGQARAPIAIPVEYHGKRQRWEVFAEVIYPQERGRRLLVRDWKEVGSISGNYGALSYLLVAAATQGNLLLKRPTDFSVTLPVNVYAELSEPWAVTVEKYWQLGDSMDVDEIIDRHKGNY